MLSRVLLALGAVAASVGLTLYGMGTSYSPERDDIKDWGIWLMVGGTVVAVAAGFWYNAQERRATVQELPAYEETKQ